jgi:hypothetical protein
MRRRTAATFRVGDRGGFALVVTVTLMVLLMVLGLGLLSLSAISMRSSQATQWHQQARDNARLALLMAIGELQRSMGPDQAVSSTATVLEGVGGTIAQGQWTAVWPTRGSDDLPIVRREEGGRSLTDLRSHGEWDRWEQARFLVSGNEGGADRFRPERPPAGDTEIELVGDGTLGAADGRVIAPRVKVGGSEGGHYAWWVGDLGVKANVALADDESERAGPLLARERGLGLLDPPLEIPDDQREKLGTLRTVALVDGAADLGEKFHDLTVDSLGVLADPRDGGLKKDLTAYLIGDGAEPALAGGDDAGLTDADRLVGPANQQLAESMGMDWDGSPFRNTAPRFGLLREWAGIAANQSKVMAAVVPKSEPDPRTPQLADFASANLTPASIASLDKTNLVPVMVEGSLYSGPSYHDTRPGSSYAYQLRLHIWPRFALWNPYSEPLELDETMVMVQVNGRKETRMTGPRMSRGSDGVWRPSFLTVTSRGLWVFGGRSTEFRDDPNFMNTTGFNDPYTGSLYFSLPATRFGPGECLVFSAARAVEYDSRNLANNRLSAEIQPHPSRSFSFTDSEIDGGINFRPDNYWEMPPDDGELAWLERIGLGWNLVNQSDDFRMMFKSRDGKSDVDFETFDTLPQISIVSSNIQYGAGWEPRIAWADNRPMRMEKTDRADPRPRLTPDVRTRQGIRLRWFRETRSNEINSGALTGTPHFEGALLGNWNPRAAYALRTPWENIGGPLPSEDRIPDDGVSGGPWFFGAYTRDLFDPAISFDNSAPVLRGGRYHGNPFGQPIEDPNPHVVFGPPLPSATVYSLATFQHAKLSEFVWHPSLAAGNSLVDPRCGLTRTVPEFSSSRGNGNGGWNPAMVGWSSDTQRSKGTDDWAAHGRAIMQDYATSDALVYDLSFELNHALWDRYFLSSGDRQQKQALAEDPGTAELPNNMMKVHAFNGSRADADDLDDYHRAAAHLMLEGAFNVNSTSVDAWTAILSATRDPATGRTRFPRFSEAVEEDWDGQGFDRDEVWGGGRSLSDDEVRRLAQAIVDEVKARGPFLGLSDFVNRRLADDETGMSGTLQAAIDRSGINARISGDLPVDRSRDLADYRHPDNIEDATLLDQTLKADCKAWGAPGYLTQADILQVIGPALAARSDSFVVRAYGDAVDAAGRVQARAWCEAVVQRQPEPVKADASGLNPLDDDGAGTDFGRRFVLRRFRWLQSEEI